MKKAESMPLSLIVTAAILLIVMIVILAMFTSKTGTAGKDIESCSYKGGQCTITSTGFCDAGSTAIPANCDITGQICCLKVLG